MVKSKSLKGFIRKDSIENEVSSWSILELESYFKRHKTHLKSNFFNKKLAIVKKYIKFNKGEFNLDLLKSTKEKNLLNFAPKEALDPKNIGIKNYQKNTGIFLWKMGYKVENCLGRGAYSVVWKCGNKAVKVVCNKKKKNISKNNCKNDHILKEIKNSIVITNLFKNFSDHHGINYVNLPKYKESLEKKAIFESELASKKSALIYKDEIRKKGILGILNFASDVLKGLDLLHDAGYSHNDIKLSNVLVYENLEKEDFFKINDFGALCGIDNPICAGTKIYAAPEYKLKNAVKKRDSFTLGVALLELLLVESKVSLNDIEIRNIILNAHPDKIYDYFLLSKFYPNESKEAILELINFIKKLTNFDYKSRISIKKALEKTNLFIKSLLLTR